jgi:hypothetical protein
LGSGCWPEAGAAFECGHETTGLPCFSGKRLRCSPNRSTIDAYDAKVKMTEDPSKLQEEMDSLNAELVKLSASSITEQYAFDAFVPAPPRAISYLTVNFLHGGWLHSIGNMWFLWLAGFVLEAYGAAGCTRCFI